MKRITNRLILRNILQIVIMIACHVMSKKCNLNMIVFHIEVVVGSVERVVNGLSIT